MKVTLILWITAVFLQEVVSTTLVRIPRDAPKQSSVRTEYIAQYEQKDKHGNGTSSTVKGNQEIIHNCGDNWNEFAEKCAALIKNLIASLANSVSSRPGDATNLQLHIKNNFNHIDQTNNRSCFNQTRQGLTDLDIASFFCNTSGNILPKIGINKDGGSNCKGEDKTQETEIQEKSTEKNCGTSGSDNMPPNNAVPQPSNLSQQPNSNNEEFVNLPQFVPEQPRNNINQPINSPSGSDNLFPVGPCTSNGPENMERPSDPPVEFSESSKNPPHYYRPSQNPIGQTPEHFSQPLPNSDVGSLTFPPQPVDKQTSSSAESQHKSNCGQEYDSFDQNSGAISNIPKTDSFVKTGTEYRDEVPVTPPTYPSFMLPHQTNIPSDNLKLENNFPQIAEPKTIQPASPSQPPKFIENNYEPTPFPNFVPKSTNMEQPPPEFSSLNKQGVSDFPPLNPSFPSAIPKTYPNANIPSTLPSETPSGKLTDTSCNNMTPGTLNPSVDTQTITETSTSTGNDNLGPPRMPFSSTNDRGYGSGEKEILSSPPLPINRGDNMDNEKPGFTPAAPNPNYFIPVVPIPSDNLMTEPSIRQPLPDAEAVMKSSEEEYSKESNSNQSEGTVSMAPPAVIPNSDFSLMNDSPSPNKPFDNLQRNPPVQPPPNFDELFRPNNPLATNENVLQPGRPQNQEIREPGAPPAIVGTDSQSYSPATPSILREPIKQILFPQPDPQLLTPKFPSAPQTGPESTTLKNQNDNPSGGYPAWEESITTTQRPTTFQTTSVDPTPPQINILIPPTYKTSSPPRSSPQFTTQGYVEPPLPRPTEGPNYHYSDSESPDDTDEYDDEDCCSCESEDESPDTKQYRKTVCKDLEEARRELKAIFDKIRKKLKCRECGREVPRPITR